ncbi:MAG: DUF1593 domain-containing protein [Chordicoccus sp.]
MKLRTIITQDAEVDDRNSLRHFLLYTNEVDLQGIVQTSSVFHWKGKAGAEDPKTKFNPFFGREEQVAPYDQPYRWTGTWWMQEEIDEYEAIYPCLKQQAEGYPEPSYLRSITKIGNVGYPGDMSGSTEGSELIRAQILDSDPRPLYIQVWGGTNTIAQALKDIECEHKADPDWPALHRKISDKVILTACGEQDETYRDYIAEQWPDIRFVVTLQMDSYAYSWGLQPDCASRDSLKGAYMKEHILLDTNPLMKHYCTWLDGQYYEGEEEMNQFGTNQNTRDMMKFLAEEYPLYEPYDFISEGDSPTFLWMLNWGFRTEEDFSFGGLSGRYGQDTTEKNSKGEPLNYWRVLRDTFTDREGHMTSQESMWPFVRDIQHDLAARARWGVTETFENAEHRPLLSVREGLDFQMKAGERQVFHADAENADGGRTRIYSYIYGEASRGDSWRQTLLAQDRKRPEEITVTLPKEAVPGDTIHVIVCAEADGRERLRAYRQIIITIIS